MTDEQVLRGVAQVISNFLERNGGAQNGYETWAEGEIRPRLIGGFRIYTPSCRDLTYRRVDELGTMCQNEVKEYLLEIGFTHPLEVIKKHDEYGVFVTTVVIKRKIDFFGTLKDYNR